MKDIKEFPEPKEELNGDNLIAYYLIIQTMKAFQIPFENALEHILSASNNKKDRNRIKNILTDIYDKNIKGDEFEKEINRASNFFKDIGWQ